METTSNLRAFTVKLPHTAACIVLAVSAGKARYRLYRHVKELHPELLRDGTGLYTYRLPDVRCRRAAEYDPIRQYGRTLWAMDFANHALHG